MQVFELPEPKFEPQSIGFSPDGQFLTVWEESRTVVIDPDGKTRLMGEHVPPDWIGRNTRHSGVGFTADGKCVVGLHIVPKGGNAIIRVYDLETGEVKRERPSRGWSVIEMGPGNRLVYTTMVNAARQIGVDRWDPLTGESLPMFGGTRRDLFQVAVSGDERTAVGSIYEAVRVWCFKGDKPPGRASKQLEAESTSTHKALTISFDGSLVAAAGSGVHVWDVESGARQTIAPRGGWGGRVVAFHPSRPLLAYSAGAEEVTFWDAIGRSAVKSFAWGIGPITAVAFSPDGLKCAAAGASKVVVWDVDV